MAESRDDISEYSSEYSESGSCGSSCSGSDEDPYYPWMDKVGSREELLGLDLGVFEDGDSLYENGCIKILGILSGQELLDIKPGDWLKSINDTPVHVNNIDDICKELSVPSRIKLTISTPYFATSTTSDCHESTMDELLGSSDVIQKTKAQLLNVPHGIFYLVMEDESQISNEGVIYRYPAENTPLFNIKGLFITLSHMISDVASPPLLSCSLTIQEELVHVAFAKEGNGTFVLAFPSSCSTISEVLDFATILVKFLKFQHTTLKVAFGFGNNENQLDYFFTLFFKHYVLEYSQKCYFDSHLMEVLPSVHWLPLPVDIKTEIDEILSELESSDYGIHEGFVRNQRIYSIFGSCLFYKGYLLCNHLPKMDLIDIQSFLHLNNLLLLTRLQSVAEIIIWKEVFPSRHQRQHYSDPDYIEVKGRWFMLTVAMNNCILVVLLEAGGCSITAEGNPPPEPFYVEEVQNTLIILHDCGIASAVEKMLHQCLPPVVSSEMFLKDGSFTRNSISSIFSNTNNSSINTSLKSAGHSSHSSLPLEKGPADGESDIESSFSDISNENLSYGEHSSRRYSLSAGSTTESQGSGKFSNIQKSATSLSDTNISHSSCPEILYREQKLSVVAGNKNTLFQYLHMDPVEGVFIAPICNLSSIQESALKYIWSKFYQCCLNLRKVFARSLRNEEIIKTSTVTKYGVNTFLRNAYEQGVLFSYTHKDGLKQKKAMQFWVIGRLFFTPEPRELYVCFHDSVHQDIVEIAFRLGFGLVL
ncbi:hypothetical protein JTE90_028936 [Oedothorax gibbosus]|uniref:Protein inturned n=1 Tax=Oedothorax gibbosus TaxID=931172 RepID=A0AAV6VJ71_9ARAC|nr:hypothetical protein JTE90_028936 [Oedothorax gibbosus]